MRDKELQAYLDRVQELMGYGPEKYELGNVVITSRASLAIHAADQLKGLARHRAGDWGDMGEGDKATNDQHLADKENGARTQSAYAMEAAPHHKFWIITDGLHSDEAVTTLLLPEDY